MDQYRVLIPGAGGAAAVGAIKSLRLSRANVYIVATDSDGLSAGLYLADRGYVVPPANHPSFMDEALRIMRREQVTVILPTSGFDIVPHSKNKQLLESLGIKVIASDFDAVETCLDKEKFYLALKDRFNLPFTTRDPSLIRSFPCVVKPVHGKGSRNIFVCSNRADLNQQFPKFEDMIIQDFLPGKEYTIDVLSDLTGHPLCAIPRERIEVRSGISFKAKIVLDSQMQEECMNLAARLKLKGPSCIQMKCDAGGVPKIMEVNPRLGGATIMATFAGINFPFLSLNLAHGKEIRIPEIQEVTMVRYYEEVITDSKGKLVKL